ncbi:MAG: hypothetical protein DDT20_01781 [Firmicutes bacterium]|nr:hypothetical protein [Bacillota bacterium]
MKRIFTLVLAALVLLASVSPVSARTDIRLTEAIRLAKQFFPETDNFRTFRSRLEAGEDRVVFHLHWSRATTDPARHNPSNIWVSVDLNRQLIVSYRHEPATPRTQSASLTAIPQFGREHAERVATDFVRRLAPAQFAGMRLSNVEEPAIIIGRRFWPHFYVFSYVRFVNNIAFPSNGLRITVNADTGTVQEYSLSWGDYTFPAPQNLISQAELTRVFNEVGLKLVYQRVQWWRPMQNKENEPFLAYILEDGSVLQIDAFTGKVTRSSWGPQLPPGIDFAASEADKARAGLTEAELKEIDFVAGLVTAERAEAIAREIAALPATVPLVASQLYGRGENGDRIWQLQFGTRHDHDMVWVGVTLDAVTGKLLTFYYTDSNYQPVAPRLELEEAQQIAQAFLARWAGDKLGDIRLVEEPAATPTDELPQGYLLWYQRFENNIPVQGDRVHVHVRHDRRVGTFGFNWYEGKFPSPAGALTPAQMNAQFLSEQGLHLQYVLEFVEVKDRSAATVVRLVYRPKALSSYNFNAFTGKNVDHTGKEIVPVVKPVYRDITGHWAERDIRQLVDLGLLRLAGPELRPDAVITVGEFLQVLSDASGFSVDAAAEARSFATLSGMMNEDEAEAADLNRPLTRELMAFYLARHQGHGQTAALQGIWSAPFRDFAAIAAEYQGSVAIVHALKLMRGDTNGNFLPREQATRAQAIVIIARMLHMQ